MNMKEVFPLPAMRPTLLPLPRSVCYDNDCAVVSGPSRPGYHIAAEAFEHPVYAHASSLLQQTLACAGTPLDGGYPVHLSVRPDHPLLEDHQTADAYAIRITQTSAELTGYNARGALYAVQTFAQLLQQQGMPLPLHRIHLHHKRL